MGTLSDTVANQILDAICQAAPVLDYDAVWVKLHTGDPGAAGTANPAANTTRQQATFGNSASGRSTTNTVQVEWINVSNSETYTWVSLWSLAAGGVFLARDDLTNPAAVIAGDTFRIPVANLTLSVT